MKRKTVLMKVTYTYSITYVHADHLMDIGRDLEKAPIFEMGGAGVASDGNVYGFSCKRKGKGIVKAD